MLTPAPRTLQLQEETQPETAPAKPKGKAASQAGDSDFNRFVGQFLGVVAQNTRRTGQELSAKAGPRGVVAQPAPQPAPQPAADASVTPPENAALFPGADSPDAMAAEGAETADPSIAAPGSEDSAGLPEPSGNEDALVLTENDVAAANTAAGSDQKPSHDPGDAAKREKPGLHELPAKQEPSGNAADESTAGDPAGTGRSSTLASDGDFSTVMRHESSGVRNLQAQLSGATITHRTHEGNGPAPLRTVNAADVLDPASVIMKDGNRLAVKFEQEGLGKLDLDLRLNKGIINARIQVNDDSTKTLIEDNMRQIVDSLLKAGLSVGGFSVSLKGGGRQDGSSEEQYGCGTERVAATGKSGDIAERAATDGLVSIFI